MYFEAYKKATLAIEKPAQSEYRIFAEITRELELATAEKSTTIDRIKAVFRNNQLWLTLKIDLMSDKNQLDKETKAGLISLAIWIEKYSGEALTGKSDLSPLIEINKNIMQGLFQSSKPAQTTAPIDMHTISKKFTA